VHLAIEAAAIADVDLVVLGDGEERVKLERLANDRGARARFVGHQRDPRPFLAECDATISTSDNEPLGLSVLESLSMERPVIAFAGGGIPEIIQKETGWLVADATAEAFATAMRAARSDRARVRAMGEAGRRFVVAECSVERMCEGYAAAYRKTASTS
jgi:glycosyltransferase involved in cell wall biosynthesis